MNSCTLLQVAGFVSSNAALRKEVFVSGVPFQLHSFYRAVVKTDTWKQNGTIERGGRDLAGNLFDREFSCAFRTTDVPLEQT